VFPYTHGSNIPLMLPSTKENESGGNSGSLDPLDLSLLCFAAVFITVLDEKNQNLTAAQKELLLWHQKLGHSDFHCVQDLFKSHLEQPPALTSTLPGVAHCDVSHMNCVPCPLVQQKRRASLGCGVSVSPNQVCCKDAVQPDNFLLPFTMAFAPLRRLPVHSKQH